MTRPLSIKKANRNIFIISLGCPRNLVDTEVLVGALKKKGFRVFFDFAALEKSKNPDIAIVNTCGFIKDAKEESIDVILELSNLKKEGRLGHLIVMGCLSQRYPQGLAQEISEIDAIFGSSTFAQIPKYIDGISKGEKKTLIEKVPSFLYSHKSPRSLLTPRHTAYVKIQEGCMNFCSYCVIPKIRGPFRSRPEESVLKEIEALKKSGVKEINLIGQDTTLYGIEKRSKGALATLLGKASQIMKSRWIRLLYTHPAHYSRDLIKAIADEPAVCKYLDLPIQHINDRILKRMNRKTSKKDIVALIENLRKNIPGLAIRTSIMVGFPGESERDFNELEEFIKGTKFERLGAFTYSPEEGTSAFSFSGQVPEKEKRTRFERIMETQKHVSEDYNKAYMGKIIEVLIDEKDSSQEDQYLGRTAHDAPEVDGTVYVKSKKKLKPGDFVNVRIEDTLEYDLTGRRI